MRILGVWIREMGVGLGRHPLRTFLLFLTFALGSASVVVTLATVEGGRRSITADLQGLGVDVVAALNPIRIGPGALGTPTPGAKLIDAAMIDELSRSIAPRVRAVIPFRMELAQMSNERVWVTTTLMATTSDFEGVLRAGLLAGRFLRDDDTAEDGVVPVVLDEALARDFVQNPADMVGEELRSFRVGRPFTARVVGVMKDPISLRRHLDAFDGNRRARNVTARRLEFKNVYVPYDPEQDDPSGVLVQVRDLDHVLPRGAEVQRFFEQRGTAPFLFVQKLWIDSVIDIVNRFSSLSHFIWVMDLVVVLLLVGTISLLAIEERYREIAIKRVEGASVTRVVVPLLAEGGVVALASLAPGYGLAQVILAQGVAPVLRWDPYLPPQALVALPVLIVVVGIASNVLAAWRVARLSPAEVLSRYEG